MANETIVQDGAAGEGASAQEPTVAGGAAADASSSTSADAGASTDWRLRIAGPDPKLLKQLERYASEADFGKAHLSLQTKLSSGEYRRALPKDATPEQVAEWRAEIGLPDKAEGYIDNLALPDGSVIPDADRDTVLAFADAALQGNIDRSGFGAMVAKYYELIDRRRADREAKDAAFQEQAEDTLREAWKGSDFKRNKNAIENMLSQWPEGAAENLLAGRMADGSRIGDNPVFAQLMAQLANRLEPGRTLVPDGFTPASQNLAQRLASIEALMGDRHSDYWKGPKAAAMQAEYRELVAARDAAKGSAQSHAA